DYTFTAADQGVHTFQITFRTAAGISWGLYDLSGLLHINSYPFPVMGPRIVAPGPLARLVLTAPDSPRSGNPFILSVSAEDQYGNLLPYYDSVTFSSKDLQAVLPGPYQFQADDAGAHTFTGVVLNTVGSQTIQVTDPRFDLNASITLDVQPGPVASPPPPAINEFSLYYGMDTIATGSDGAMWGHVVGADTGFQGD